MAAVSLKQRVFQELRDGAEPDGDISMVDPKKIAPKLNTPLSRVLSLSEELIRDGAIEIRKDGKWFLAERPSLDEIWKFEHLGAGERLILLYFRMHPDTSSFSGISNNQIARIIGHSSRHVTQLLYSLQKRGYVERIHQTNEYGGNAPSRFLLRRPER